MHSNLKVAMSYAKINKNFLNYLLKTKTKNKMLYRQKYKLVREVKLMAKE